MPVQVVAEGSGLVAGDDTPALGNLFLHPRQQSLGREALGRLMAQIGSQPGLERPCRIHSVGFQKRLRVRLLTPSIRAACDCLSPAEKRFFLRCSPRVVGSLVIGKLRVQTGVTCFRTTCTTLSQKGNERHSRRENARRIAQFATRNTKISGQNFRPTARPD